MKFKRGQWVRFKGVEFVDTPYKVLGYEDAPGGPGLVCLDNHEDGGNMFILEDDLKLVVDKPEAAHD